MSELAYELDEQQAEITTVSVVRDGLVSCGPVPVPDFGAHRARIVRTVTKMVYASRQCSSDDNLLWAIVPSGTDELPLGYIMMQRGGEYIVVNESGAVIAGHDSDPVVVLNDAWTHYNSSFCP